MTESTELKQHCMCDFCKNGVIHKDDCAVHNELGVDAQDCSCEPGSDLLSEDFITLWNWAHGEGWSSDKITLEVFMGIISEHKRWQSQLRKEIEGVIGEYEATEADKEMPKWESVASVIRDNLRAEQRQQLSLLRSKWEKA